MLIPVCPEHTYGIGCQPCPENCKDSQCDKFSEEMKCLYECASGFSGDNCQTGESMLKSFCVSILYVQILFI